MNKFVRAVVGGERGAARRAVWGDNATFCWRCGKPSTPAAVPCCLLPVAPPKPSPPCHQAGPAPPTHSGSITSLWHTRPALPCPPHPTPPRRPYPPRQARTAFGRWLNSVRNSQRMLISWTPASEAYLVRCAVQHMCKAA